MKQTPLKRTGFKRKTLAEVKAKQAAKRATSKNKKPTVAKLKKEADSWFSRYIRLRDSDKNGLAECITCGLKKPWRQQQNGHFVTRGVNSLRYNDQNCNAQCVGCNMFKSGNLFQYGIALDMKYGDGTAKALHAQRFDTHKLTIEELQQIISDAKEYIETCGKS